MHTEMFADKASCIAAENLFPNGKAGQWHEPVIVDETEIRTFLEIVHAHVAKLAAPLIAKGIDPGALQLSRISPGDGNTVPTRYLIGDVDGMVRDAIASADAGHNVYIEGRTVSRDVHGKRRGSDSDTVFVFAFVIDNDADKDKATSLEIEATITIETSPGNSHQWLFLDSPVDWKAAKELGQRLRKAAEPACGCTGKISNPYRVPGTPNYPDAKKREAGRHTCSTSIVQRSDRLWSTGDMEQAFPPIPEHQALDYGDIDDLGVFLIDEALKAIPNNPPLPHQILDDRPCWLGVLFACSWAYNSAATPEIAEQIEDRFFKWSDKAKNAKGAKPDHDHKQRDRIWKNAKAGPPNSKRGPIRIGTLFKYAAKYGWNKNRAERPWYAEIERRIAENTNYWCEHRDEYIALMYQDGEPRWEPLPDTQLVDGSPRYVEANDPDGERLRDMTSKHTDPPFTLETAGVTPQQEELAQAGDKQEPKTNTDAPRLKLREMTLEAWKKAYWGNGGGARDDGEERNGKQEQPIPPKRRKTVKEFCDAYKPARRIVGDFIEAGYVYFLTAPAFMGKTQLATTLMHAIAANSTELLGIEVRGGRVAYLALENPDDTRKRIMGQRYEYGLDHNELAPKITIIDEFSRRDAKGEPVSPLLSAGTELREDCAENGPLSVVFIDSYQAAFAGDDFNNNKDMLERFSFRLHRNLRRRRSLRIPSA